MAKTPIIVMGASAGGVEALQQIVRDLPQDLPAAIVVGMHFPSGGTSVLPQILSRAGKLKAVHPADGDLIQPGRIYVAAPDYHLLVGRTHLRVIRGPRENGHRPAIDPIFRSAALSYGRNTIAVLLTGNLDDGTAGLLQVKRHGGIVIVQDPADAMYPSMPQSALDHVRADHVLPLARIAAVMTETVLGLATTHTSIPAQESAMHDDDERETAYDALDLQTIEDVEHHPGAPSQFGCPDCGGVLWEIRDGALLRYRCRVGHAWSSDALVSRQSDQMDAALWMALRALEEHVSLMETLSGRAVKRGNDVLAAKYERRMHEARIRARTIRQFLLREDQKPPGELKAGAG